MSGMSGSQQQQQQQQHLQYLGDTSAALPDFGHVTLSPGDQFPRGVTAEHVLVFEQLYREHCEVLTVASRKPYHSFSCRTRRCVG